MAHDKVGLPKPLSSSGGSGEETVRSGNAQCGRPLSRGEDYLVAEGLSLPLAFLLGQVVQGTLTPWRPCGPECLPTCCCRQIYCHPRT
jgi:hypothetical protein